MGGATAPGTPGLPPAPLGAGTESGPENTRRQRADAAATAPAAADVAVSAPSSAFVWPEPVSKEVTIARAAFIAARMDYADSHADDAASRPPPTASIAAVSAVVRSYVGMSDMRPVFPSQQLSKTHQRVSVHRPCSFCVSRLVSVVSECGSFIVGTLVYRWLSRTPNTTTLRRGGPSYLRAPHSNTPPCFLDSWAHALTLCRAVLGCSRSSSRLLRHHGRGRWRERQQQRCWRRRRGGRPRVGRWGVCGPPGVGLGAGAAGGRDSAGGGGRRRLRRSRLVQRGPL